MPAFKMKTGNDMMSFFMTVMTCLQACTILAMSGNYMCKPWLHHKRQHCE